MPRRRLQEPTRRFHLTFDRTVADRLAARAEAVGRPLATVASMLVQEALDRAETDEGAELRDARRQIEELTSRVQSLRRQLAERTVPEQVEPPAARWEWPIDALLADTEWWDRWLPRLNELMGRQPPFTDWLESAGPAVDERGYFDLLAFVFPPLAPGGTTVTWRSPEYPEASRGADTGRGGVGPSEERAEIWEPVIRHAIEALCALESTGQSGVDPYLRLRAEAEITGPWARVLRYLLGELTPELPGAMTRAARYR